MRGMRGSPGSYTPRGGGVATSQQAASGLVISNVSDHDYHDDNDHAEQDDDHHDGGVDTIWRPVLYKIVMKIKIIMMVTIIIIREIMEIIENGNHLDNFR